MINFCDTITTVGELKEILNAFDDNDSIVIETIDLETGDTEDLYPFHIDAIDGIQLEDGSTIREIRICQQPNVPMPEKKQSLVDAVIEDLKNDFDYDDYTVLEELLKMIPKENLIHALPEERWGDFK